MTKSSEVPHVMRCEEEGCQAGKRGDPRFLNPYAVPAPFPEFHGTLRRLMADAWDKGWRRCVDRGVKLAKLLLAYRRNAQARHLAAEGRASDE
jgi:hypothetical protein